MGHRGGGGGGRARCSPPALGVKVSWERGAVFGAGYPNADFSSGLEPPPTHLAGWNPPPPHTHPADRNPAPLTSSGLGPLSTYISSGLGFPQRARDLPHLQRLGSPRPLAGSPLGPPLLRNCGHRCGGKVVCQTAPRGTPGANSSPGPLT